MKKILLSLIFILPYFGAAECNQPNYCNRSCWDPAGTHPAQNNPTNTNVTHIIVHHTGDPSVFPPGTNYAERVRAYWDLHVNTNGWSDISYNWLIDRNGVIYEGRGNSILGSHFSCTNTGTMGVALIGNFGLESPSTAAINSLKNLIAWESTDKNINITNLSYHNSSQLNLNNLSGHRDGNSSASPTSCASGTVCPGTSLYNLLPTIRTDVSNLPCYNGDSSNHPDLVIEELWTEPSNPQVGEDVDLYVRIKNVGDMVADDIHLEYFINGDYIDDDTHSSLEPNEEREEYENNYAFDTPGIYNYCVYIDGVTNEQNTANNSYCITINVGSGGSGNIQVSNASVNPTTVNAGADIEVSATQSYTGTQEDSDLPSFDLDYYLSSDCNLSANDILLGGSSSSLGSDDPTHEESENLTIPIGTTVGAYYIIFSADNENELAETNETDNIACVQITVTSGGAENILVSNASVSPTTVNAGEDIEVSATQSYTGSQSDANLGTFDLDYYLSNDCNLSANDIFLGGDSSSLGSDDPVHDESETLTIPSETSPGIYYIIFSADHTDELSETDETDNIACIQITIEDALSISENELRNNLSIYPNPSSDFINITITDKTIIKEIYLYNANGRLVMKHETPNLKKINVSELANGIYLMKLISDKNQKAVFRIIKK